MACAESSEKPACKASNNGEFWPQQANASREAFQQFVQNGELQICTLVVWKYKWEYLTVNVHDMGHNQHSAAGKKASSANTPGLRSSD